MMSWSLPRNSTNPPWLGSGVAFSSRTSRTSILPPSRYTTLLKRPDCLTPLTPILYSLLRLELRPRTALACLAEQLHRHASRESAVNRRRSGPRQYHRRRRPSALPVAKPPAALGCAPTAQKGNYIVPVEFVHPQMPPPEEQLESARYHATSERAGSGMVALVCLDFAMPSADLGFRV